MATKPQGLRGNGLPEVQRLITDHDSSGKAILSKSIPEKGVWQTIGKDAEFFVGYTTRQFPVSLSPSNPSDPSSIPKDVQSYRKDLESPPGLSISSGTVLRYVDMAPNLTSPMHRTVSMDYGIVLEGEVELVLDSGETRLMRRGDSCIQRATNHAWRNVTPKDGWARMVYVLIASEKPEIAGKELGEELNGMTSVRASD